MLFATVAIMVAALAGSAANYSAVLTTVDGIEVVRLADAAHKTEVSIVPSLGNNAYEMKVNGKNVFWSPYRSLGELKEKPVQVGNPLLSPWANRIDGDSYWANGKKYLLNPDLKNFRYDQNRKPIHGLLVYSDRWQVVKVRADGESASVTSRLDFWRYPDYMAQFPFAYTISMTYRLKGGELEVETAIENLSAEPLPLSLGYHTYYRLDDSPRDDWRVHVAARRQVITSDQLVPTGETKPVALEDPQPLRTVSLDTAFTDLVRDSAGRAEFSVIGRAEKLRVVFGPKFDVAVIFAPPGREFICFEPMAGLTNAFNLAHAGLFKGLQSIPAGGTWKESFWIIPENF
jgi:aldose 1-epimerase